MFLGKLLMDHLTQDWRDIIPRIKVPSLLLTGDASHAITEEAAEWIAGHLEKCMWVRFSKKEGGTHNLMVNAPEKFNRAVLDFLAN